MDRQPVVIHVPGSHLYRGMHLRAVCGPGARRLVLSEQQDAEVLMLFKDGSYAPADLAHGQGGQVALRVAAYTTARGISIRARTWTLQAMVECEDGLDIHLASSWCEMGSSRRPRRQTRPRDGAWSIFAPKTS